MLFTDSPYYAYVQRVRRMIGDEDNPVPSLKVSATLGTNSAPRVIVSYTGPVGNTVAASQLIVRDMNSGTTHVADQVFDLTTFTTLRDLAVALDQLPVGDAVLNVGFMYHPIRNQNPTDLNPTSMLLNPVPKVMYQRHWLSDEDIADELDGACVSHNTDYVINPAKATGIVTGANGQPTMPFPIQSEYPYPLLARGGLNYYTVPANEAFFVCMLAAAQCMTRVATRFAKIPTIQNDGATVDRQAVAMELRTAAQELLDTYEELYGRSGLSIRVNDLNRKSMTLGVLTQIPDINPGYQGLQFTLARWLSPLIPNLVQPTTQDNANPYSGAGGLLGGADILAIAPGTW